MSAVSSSTFKWKSPQGDIQTRQRVQYLIQNFDKYLQQTHNNSSNVSLQDQKILLDWQILKQKIQSLPEEIQSHHQYINKMNNDNLMKSRQSIRSSVRKGSTNLFGSKNINGQKKDKRVLV